ncbi:myosin phosphatase Rho-interacting protein-like isoform X2 [Denticeps clupeoides]|uniref:myosin phosphatase Rho-interacting protein-like isoform X2 n=1 Tax=Denticeps clupeoides TaxID=299321 RepID=UPI0010A3A565|nr:myosin phosphatase Rho-interacting protein-like isoform X2 [Denticeps clupeoides]
MIWFGSPRMHVRACAVAAAVPRLSGRRRAAPERGDMDPRCTFRPNVFNKSKCQGCFRPRELHLEPGEGLEQAQCEQGLLMMAATHQKTMASLREEKDRLMAEETAATAAALEALKREHQRELQRLLQHVGDEDLEDRRKQCSEELAASRREMDVLSQQYSLKCLESAHLAQALEAERRALQQCQRENREIRARHQELSSGVGVEILHRSAPPNTQQKSLCGLEIRGAAPEAGNLLPQGRAAGRPEGQASRL